MSSYEKKDLILTSLALAAAIFFGFQQVKLNQQLVHENYEPALSVQYTKPNANGSSGINILNNGKSNIDFYQITLGGSTSTDIAKQAVIDVRQKGTILPGSFIFTTPSISDPSLDVTMNDKNSNILIPINVYFKTGNGEKYLMQTWLHFWTSSSERILNYGPVSYTQFSWKER